MQLLPALATLTVFLGAALLFAVQPMAARTVLPVLGGSPSVWNTAMVFFQLALLGGYGWADASVRLLGVARQARLHTALVLATVALLPVVSPADAPPADVSPVPWLLATLGTMLGPFVLLLSANAPLVQRWFAASGHASARDPYFLYAASNAGSLLALASYPLLIEPRTTLAQQWRWWSAGFALFAVCTAASALLGTRGARDETAAPLGPPISARQRARWLVLALVPASLLLAVTQLLTTDIAPVPLLWVLPLATYLLSFIVVFARRPPISVAWTSAWLPYLAVPMALTSFLVLPGIPLPAIVVLHLVGLFAAAVTCHGRLAAERPPAGRLTEFYLLLALGGVLGGVLTALVAPLAFSWIAEYPLALVAACLLRPKASPTAPAREFPVPLVLGGVFFATLWAAPRVGVSDPWWSAVTPYLAVSVAALFLAPRVWGFGLAVATLLGLAQLAPEDRNRTLYRERTFFGVHRVATDPDGVWHSLSHGATEHGRQPRLEGLRRLPTMYFHPTGPLGDVFRAWRSAGTGGAVGVVGLGTGTVAAYLRPGERLDFFEIDPAVVRIARDPRLFSYLADSGADIRIVVGDGRRRLAEVPDGSYALLILDAFSSDALPVHLITVEALLQYRRTLAPSGVIVANQTNRHLDLVPVTGATGAAAGFEAVARADRDIDERARLLGKEASTWIVLAPPGSPMLAALRAAGWTGVTPDGRRPWTDDHVDLIGALRLWR